MAKETLKCQICRENKATIWYEGNNGIFAGCKKCEIILALKSITCSDKGKILFIHKARSKNGWGSYYSILINRKPGHRLKKELEVIPLYNERLMKEKFRV